MNLKFKKALGLAVAAVGVLLVATEPAFAASVGTPDANAGLGRLSANMKNSAGSVSDILSMASYVIGIGFGIKAALKFKESNENKGQTPISQPITLLVVSACLLALPSLLIVGKESVFGTGSSGTGLNGSELRSVN